MSRIKRSGGNKPLGKLNNAGFSLVEVLVAMAVLAILSVPVLSSFTNAARINHKARKEQKAATEVIYLQKVKQVRMERAIRLSLSLNRAGIRLVMKMIRTIITTSILMSTQLRTLC